MNALLLDKDDVAPIQSYRYPVVVISYVRLAMELRRHVKYLSEVEKFNKGETSEARCMMSARPLFSMRADQQEHRPNHLITPFRMST